MLLRRDVYDPTHTLTFYNNCLRRVTSLKLHSPRAINVCHYRNTGAHFLWGINGPPTREIPLPSSGVLHIYRFISNPAEDSVETSMLLRHLAIVSVYYLTAREIYGRSFTTRRTRAIKGEIIVHCFISI